VHDVGGSGGDVGGRGYWPQAAVWGGEKGQLPWHGVIPKKHVLALVDGDSTSSEDTHDPMVFNPLWVLE
jgi:hypothetical protein